MRDSIDGEFVSLIENAEFHGLKAYNNTDGSVTLKWKRPGRFKATDPRIIIAYKGEIYSLPIPLLKEEETVNVEVRIGNLV